MIGDSTGRVDGDSQQERSDFSGGWDVQFRIVGSYFHRWLVHVRRLSRVLCADDSTFAVAVGPNLQLQCLRHHRRPNNGLGQWCPTRFQ